MIINLNKFQIERIHCRRIQMASCNFNYWKHSSAKSKNTLVRTKMENRNFTISSWPNTQSKKCIRNSAKLFNNFRKTKYFSLINMIGKHILRSGNCIFRMWVVWLYDNKYAYHHDLNQLLNTANTFHLYMWIYMNTRTMFQKYFKPS